MVVLGGIFDDTRLVSRADKQIFIEEQMELFASWGQQKIGLSACFSLDTPSQP